MKYRTLGRTGIQVSAYALGAMFGASGNPGHDDSVRIIRTALDAGGQLHRHRRGGSPSGESQSGCAGAEAQSR